MTCRQARASIHSLLDGALEDRTALDAHLGDCPACRGFLADLTRLDGALRRSLECPVDEARLPRLTASALESAQEEGRRGSGGLAVLGTRLAAGAALLVVFAAGALSGRALWPRETLTTRTVTVPRVVEKIVEKTVRVPVEVPVVQEVAVLRTRVVYRERVVEVPRPAPTEPTIILAQTPPAKADEIVVRVPTGPFAAPAVSTELHPARIVEPDPSAEEPEPPRAGSLGERSGRRVAQAASAAVSLGSSR